MKSLAALVRADLKLLAHRPENMLATVLYGIMVLVIVHFSLPAGTGQSLVLGTAALWLALVFSAVLGLPRLQHHPDAVQFLPQLITGNISTTGYYWGKIVSGEIVLFSTSVVLFPLGILFFNFPLSSSLLTAFILFEVGTLGVVVILTLASALTVGRESWLLPLLVFPLLIPIVLSGTQLMVSMIAQDKVIPWAWVHLLVAYELLMLLGGWFLSEFIWEELPE